MPCSAAGVAKGGFYYPVSMDVPAFPYPDYAVPAKGRVDNPDHKYPFVHETITTGIREATLTGQPYPIKGWFVYGTNLILTGPFAPAFWVLVVGLGLLIPFVIQRMAVNHRMRHTAVAPLMVIAGGLLLRFVIVNARWTMSRQKI